MQQPLQGGTPFPVYQDPQQAPPPPPQEGIAGLLAQLAAHAASAGNGPMDQAVQTAMGHMPPPGPPVQTPVAGDLPVVGPHPHQSPQEQIRTLHHLGGILRQLGHPAFQGHTLPGLPSDAHFRAVPHHPYLGRH